MSALLLRQPHADDASLRSIHRPAEKVEDAATASTIVLAARFTFIRQFARFASPPSFNPPPPPLNPTMPSPVQGPLNLPYYFSFDASCCRRLTSVAYQVKLATFVAFFSAAFAVAKAAVALPSTAAFFLSIVVFYVNGV